MSPHRPATGVAAATADAPAATMDPVSPRRPAVALGGRDLFAAPTFYPVLTVVALAVGALSLLIPSTPSYDPWSWLLWAHQIIHGQLIITTGGTSWKPLPMIFTIPFALFGNAAPDLWLIVARAGALVAAVMVFRLAYRLTREVGGLFGTASVDLGRLTTVAPALLAGVIATVSLVLSASGGFVSSNTLGYSEGFAAALLLISVERHLDGRYRQCFLVGFFVALDRPEIWLFWGPYGLWLFWRDSGARILVAACFVLIPICWFLPVYAGCGSVTCSVSRATHPRSNSLAFASDPFTAELTKAAWPTMLLRIKGAAVVLGLVTVGLLWRARRTGLRQWLSAANRARLATTLIGLGGLAWFVVIAVMTQAGFSGNNRYLVLGSALVDICGAVAFGWAARELAVLGMRRFSRGDGGTGSAGRGRASAMQWAGTALAALVFIFGPNWIGKNLISIPRTHGSLVYQARLRQGMEDLVARYGGSAKVFACGSVMTEGFQVPMVAWTLGVPATHVEATPLESTPESGSEAPNVILQTRDTRSAHLLPFLSTWPTVTYHYVGTAGPVHMFTHCTG